MNRHPRVPAPASYLGAKRRLNTLCLARYFAAEGCSADEISAYLGLPLLICRRIVMAKSA